MRPIVDLRARCACAAGLAFALTYTPLTAHAQAATDRAAARDTTVPSAPIAWPIAPTRPIAPWPAPQHAVAAPRIASLAAPTAGGRESLAYGQRVVLRGDVGSAWSGAPLTLQYRPAGSSSWSQLAHTRTGPRGRYTLSARPPESGSLRVALLGRRIGARRTAVLAASGTLGVTVSAGVSLRPAVVNVLAGHQATVAGRLLPGRSGGRIVLQARVRSRWVTLARSRTGSAGRFHLGYTPQLPGIEVVRVRFVGDARNAAAQTRSGRVLAFHVAIASWYASGGVTACGQNLTDSTLGVANKTLPCGTLVVLRYRGRSVEVPVIDRGPFVPGRDYDLTFATKAALHFPDLAPLWATK